MRSRLKPIWPLGAAVLLIGASAVAFSQSQKTSNASLNVSLPGKSWTLRIDAPGFEVKVDEMQESGREYLMAENAATGVSLSVTLEKTEGKADVGDCRNTLQEQTKDDGRLKVTDSETRDANGVPIVEYLLPEVNGFPVRQRNLFACMVKDDVYAYIHLSKIHYRPQDEKLLTSILDATDFDQMSIPESASNPRDVRQLLKDGDRAFQRGNFAGAIEMYQEAFDIEKKQPTLDRAATHILIDNLGMVYGINGNLDGAREIYDFGVSRDPSYPMFYYNIACLYGRKKDLENAIAYLQKAFANKTNMASGETVPDPRNDGSFASFKDDDRFVKAVDSMMKTVP